MSEAVTKRIDELLSERNWTVYRLAREAYLPVSTIRNLYCGHTKSPTLSVIFKLANAFGLTAIEFLDSELFFSDELEYE